MAASDSNNNGFWVVANNLDGRCGSMFDSRTASIVSHTNLRAIPSVYVNNEPAIVESSQIEVDSVDQLHFASLNTPYNNPSSPSSPHELTEHQSRIIRRQILKYDETRIRFLRFTYRTKLESLPGDYETASLLFFENSLKDPDSRATHIVHQVQWGIRVSLIITIPWQISINDDFTPVDDLLQNVCMILDNQVIDLRNVPFEDEILWNQLMIYIEENGVGRESCQNTSLHRILHQIIALKRDAFRIQIPLEFYLKPKRWLSGRKKCLNPEYYRRISDNSYQSRFDIVHLFTPLNEKRADTTYIDGTPILKHAPTEVRRITTNDVPFPELKTLQEIHHEVQQTSRTEAEQTSTQLKIRKESKNSKSSKQRNRGKPRTVTGIEFSHGTREIFDPDRAMSIVTHYEQYELKEEQSIGDTLSEGSLTTNSETCSESKIIRISTGGNQATVSPALDKKRTSEDQRQNIYDESRTVVPTDYDQQESDQDQSIDNAEIQFDVMTNSEGAQLLQTYSETKKSSTINQNLLDEQPILTDADRNVKQVLDIEYEQNTEDQSPTVVPTDGDKQELDQDQPIDDAEIQFEVMTNVEGDQLLEAHSLRTSASRNDRILLDEQPTMNDAEPIVEQTLDTDHKQNIEDESDFVAGKNGDQQEPKEGQSITDDDPLLETNSASARPPRLDGISLDEQRTVNDADLNIEQVSDIDHEQNTDDESSTVVPTGNDFQERKEDQSINDAYRLVQPHTETTTVTKNDRIPLDEQPTLNDADLSMERPSDTDHEQITDDESYTVVPTDNEQQEWEVAQAIDDTEVPFEMMTDANDNQLPEIGVETSRSLRSDQILSTEQTPINDPEISRDRTSDGDHRQDSEDLLNFTSETERDSTETISEGIENSIIVYPESMQKEENSTDIDEESMNISVHSDNISIVDEKTSNFEWEQDDITLSEYPLNELALDEEFTTNTPYVESISEPTDINVLLLGETGVGKSTFINAFVNYLLFDTLKQASEDSPAVVIPVTFVTTKGPHFEEVTIEFGNEDPNEKHECLGQSSTQNCRSYTLNINEKTRLRFIDSPGIGDSRGYEQDQKNIDQTLSYLNHFGHLNAICILLKPMETRMNVFFRFCLLQLFNYLSGDAHQNIVFCFTNTRPSFFVPGETGSLLAEFLKDAPITGIVLSRTNVYSFDSESFRYLVCKQNGIEFNEEDEKQYSTSWNHSVTESIRFFNYIQMLPTYYMSRWQSKKHAELQIKTIIRPMMEVLKTTLYNIALKENNRREHLLMLIQPNLNPHCHLSCSLIDFKLVYLGRIPVAHYVYVETDDDDTNEENSDVPSCVPVDYKVNWQSVSNKDHSFHIEDDLNNWIQSIVTFSRFIASSDIFLFYIDQLLYEQTKICNGFVLESVQPIVNCIRENLEMFKNKLNNSYDERNNDENVQLSEIYQWIEWVKTIADVHNQLAASEMRYKLIIKDQEMIIEKPNRTTGFLNRLKSSSE